MQDKSRRSTNNRHLRARPLCLELTQVTELQVSRSSPNSPHLRSKADTTSTIEAENTGADSPSVVDSTHQRSSAAVTAADNVLSEQFVVSVFESQPKQSAVNVKLREWKVAEGDSEYITDNEES